MTVVAPELEAILLDVIDDELEQAREDLIQRVGRIDALSDLRHHALTFRDARDTEPTFSALLEATTDEIARAELLSLARRIATDEENPR